MRTTARANEHLLALFMPIGVCIGLLHRANAIFDAFSFRHFRNRHKKSIFKIAIPSVKPAIVALRFLFNRLTGS